MPDLRGLFLRGHGSQASAHYGVVTHQSGALGVVQGDAIRNITGGFRADTGAQGWAGAWGAFVNTGFIGQGDTGQSVPEIAVYSFDASRIVPTAAENRPVNVAVRYLIRASQ